MHLFQHKKQLGQHFLIDVAIAQNIVHALEAHHAHNIVEVGPGSGALTKWLVAKFMKPMYLIERDSRLIDMLKQHYSHDTVTIINEDFLAWSTAQKVTGNIAIIGNFPYNISSQIFFNILENRQQITEVVCMVQDEVAQRIASPPGSRKYGILSVLLQAFYTITYLFQVPPNAFDPPPKVFSGVMRLQRHSAKLACDEKAFFHLVKAGFHQRRKMLRNTLTILNKPLEKVALWLTKRAEALSVADFVTMTNLLYPDGDH